MSAAGLERQRAPLVPVSRLRVECPVCGKRDNCALSEDRRVAYCRRVRSDRPGSDGGWTHFIDPSVVPPPPQRRPSHIEAVARAPVGRLDGVYSTLLRGHLELSDRHRDALRARGLSDAEINRNGYASTPDARRGQEIAEALSAYDLRGVPGFTRRGGRWGMVGTPPGLLIPYRDERGRIRALQHRPDVTPEDGGKYRWLSSRHCSSGAPLHFAYRHLLATAREVTITEGALKADVTSFFLGSPVVAAAGVTQFGQRFAVVLKAACPALRTVFVAFDLDFRRNEAVKGALFRLLSELEREGFDARLRAWPPGLGKGIDDCLLAVAGGRVA